MKRFVFSLIAMLVACCVAAPANAGAFGSSILQISNARLQVETALNSGIYVDATAADVNVVFNFVNASTTASYAALNASAVNTIGFDASQSFVSPSLPGPIENSFTSYGNPLADGYARADTTGSGTTLIAGGVGTSTLAEASSLNTSTLASSTGNVNGFSQFLVTSTSTRNFKLAYDAVLDLQNAGLGGYADSKFSVTVNTPGLPESYRETAINKELTSAGTLHVAGSFSSQSISFIAGQSYLVTIAQSSTAKLTTVPEPSSLAILGLLCAGALVTGRRYRKS